MSADAGQPAAVRAGWRALASAPAGVRLLVAALFVLTLLMLPVGRAHLNDWRRANASPHAKPDDAGSLLAPLSFDAGQNFRLRPGADFYAVYEAGYRLRTGGDPYGAGLTPPLRAPDATQFRYPLAAAAWLGVPLSLLPPQASYALWVALGPVMLIANFLLCLGRAPTRAIPLAVVWFAWFPAVPEWHMGQFTLLLATLMLWAADALVHGVRLAGAPWLLAVTLKVYPLAWAPVFWLRGRKRAVLVACGALAASAFLATALYPKGTEVGILRGGLVGAIIAPTHQPYAGAQGVQEAVNALLWKARGHALAEPTPDRLPVPSDPVALVSLALVAGYAALALWALLHGARTHTPEVLGILWLAWFIAFRDNWEHHYMLLQALCGFLLAHGVIGGRVALAAWVFAGAPSLWWFWQRLGYSGGGGAEFAGLLYFLQRPPAVLLLLAVLAHSIARRGPDDPTT